MRSTACIVDKRKNTARLRADLEIFGFARASFVLLGRGARVNGTESFKVACSASLKARMKV
ncbi:hypothetical protein GCM10007338_05850 [Corynebacterium pelargi]|nr:hypothetical protein GCM10007338_05850 [Corynebacterium pelargi]